MLLCDILSCIIFVPFWIVYFCHHRRAAMLKIDFVYHYILYIRLLFRIRFCECLFGFGASFFFYILHTLRFTHHWKALDYTFMESSKVCQTKCELEIIKRLKPIHGKSTRRKLKIKQSLALLAKRTNAHCKRSLQSCAPSDSQHNSAISISDGILPPSFRGALFFPNEFRCRAWFPLLSTVEWEQNKSNILSICKAFRASFFFSFHSKSTICIYFAVSHLSELNIGFPIQFATCLCQFHCYSSDLFSVYFCNVFDLWIISICLRWFGACLSPIVCCLHGNYPHSSNMYRDRIPFFRVCVCVYIRAQTMCKIKIVSFDLVD